MTKELEQILIQLRPGGVIHQLQEVKSTQSGKPSSQSKVSDVMAAISGLNSDEKLQIKAALFGMTTDIGVKDTYGGSKAFGLPKKVESQKVVISAPVLHEPQYGQMNQLSGIAPLPASTPHLDQTFHFGKSNTVHNIRVTTFSGSWKDCSFEQFRYDVQCLVNQGCPEEMVLTAMKRPIKGQAQETVLHMGKDATVSDILTRFEMMFGDVDSPHVLLAQFCSLEQMAGEGITDWYSRVEDLASRIIRKDATVISPHSYGIVVNTQF